MFRANGRLALAISMALVGLVSNVIGQGLLISSEQEFRHPLPRIMPPIRQGQPGFLYDIAKLEVDASWTRPITGGWMNYTLGER